MDNGFYCSWSTPGVHNRSGGVPSDSCNMDYDQQQRSNNEYNLECYIWWESSIGVCGDDNSNCCCHVAFDAFNEVGILSNQVVEG